jgi:hypothetical protein
LRDSLKKFLSDRDGRQSGLWIIEDAGQLTMDDENIGSDKLSDARKDSDILSVVESAI